MRWNQLAHDIPRASALADILCGAAAADGYVADDELVIVRAMLMKVLGVTSLPEAIDAHVAAFKPKGFDVAKSLEALALTTDRERKSLYEVVKDVVEADAHVAKKEKAYLTKLGKLLGQA